MQQDRRPPYRVISDALRAAILNGQHEPGSKLPTEPEIADQYGTSRATAGQALRMLKSEGLVTRRGRSNYVAPIIGKIPRDATARYMRTLREEGQARGAFHAEIKRLGMDPITRSEIKRVLPPDDVARLFKIEAGTVAVVARERWMGARPAGGEEAPLQLATSYFPVDIAGGTAIEQPDTGPGGSKSRLADLGYPQATITEEIDVRTPEPAEATALDMAEDQRLYQVTHIGRTEDGRAVEVAVHLMPAHLWSLSYTWNLGSDH